MPATDDEIREKYLERAIRELNASHARHPGAAITVRAGQLMPVLGSGHPQADIMMLKYAPRPSEIEEGVAFYGRSGNALMKSLQRPADRSAGRLRHAVREVPGADTSLADPACIARVAEEIAIVSPKIIVMMGEDALYALNELMLPMAHPLSPRIGEIQQLTPQISVLHVPNIDQALDEERAKRAFWASFRPLGDWFADLPPY